MNMFDRVCPLCGSDDDSHIFAEANFDLDLLDKFAFASRKIPEYMHYRMISCSTCDLLYATPLPAAETLLQNYSDADFDSSIEAHCAALTYANFLPAIIDCLPDQKGALDIGTGDGAFLKELLKFGFNDVVGIEPSKAPIIAAEDEIRPLIREGFFRPEEFSKGTFSIITCFQTLEHLSDPLSMCLSANAMLKEGGAVFFICHNRRALLAKVLGIKSPIFDIEHLQLFSPDSAMYLLHKSGFEDVQIKRVMNHYPLSYWIKLFPMPSTIKRVILDWIANSRLGSLRIPFAVGNFAVIGYKKKSCP